MGWKSKNRKMVPRDSKKIAVPSPSRAKLSTQNSARGQPAMGMGEEEEEGRGNGFRGDGKKRPALLKRPKMYDIIRP